MSRGGSLLFRVGGDSPSDGSPPLAVEGGGVCSRVGSLGWVCPGEALLLRVGAETLSVVGRESPLQSGGRGGCSRVGESGLARAWTEDSRFLTRSLFPSLLTHKLVLLCADAYFFIFWDLPWDVLAAPDSALCGWMGVILCSLSLSLSLHPAVLLGLKLGNLFLSLNLWWKLLIAVAITSSARLAGTDVA